MTRFLQSPPILVTLEDRHKSNNFLFSEPFLLQPADELQFVWCELFSQALAAIWSSSVTADPNLWLKWDSQRLKDQPVSKKHLGIDIKVSTFYASVLSGCWKLV